ncbi:hypothetical protein HMSSN139_17940 [Paenibacillus sp. HMSSN-139]|jgi:hypothetical protein|uniref:hypothetical protein n=1 Tax=Paenibacillus timonensis TaxID=225915 RepID=UPI00208393E1|nr:hypothetical protein [Paenibacillus timonensis]GJM79298.1 hypothetical protein HMSSN139_17940 [Paenibacillus sp. HMSSN-139]
MAILSTSQGGPGQISYKLSEDFQGSLLYDVKKRLTNAIWSKTTKDDDNAELSLLH